MMLALAFMPSFVSWWVDDVAARRNQARKEAQEPTYKAEAPPEPEEVPLVGHQQAAMALAAPVPYAALNSQLEGMHMSLQQPI